MGSPSPRPQAAARKLRVMALFVAVVLPGAGAQASGVLFVSGNGRMMGHNAISREQTFVAQDFELRQDSTLDGLILNAMTFPDVTESVTAVHARVYLDDGGAVGEGIYSAVLTSASSTTLGPSDTDPYVLTDYAVALPDWALPAGRYWLGLRVDPAQTEFHWTEVNDRQFGYDGLVGDAEGTPASYESYPFEHVFSLTGNAVPLPPAAWSAAALVLAASAVRTLRSVSRMKITVK